MAILDVNFITKQEGIKRGGLFAYINGGLGFLGGIGSDKRGAFRERFGLVKRFSISMRGVLALEDCGDIRVLTHSTHYCSTLWILKDELLLI